MLELNKLYLMDCMEGMAQFPDKYFDLAIVDPPYGILQLGMKFTRPDRKKGHGDVYKSKHKVKSWDNEKPTKDYFSELERITKNRFIFGGNYFTDYLQPSGCWVFWDKKNGDGNHFADGEFVWTSFKSNSRLYRLSVYHGTNGGKDRIHPTQKPVQLYKWILYNYAKPDFKIIDTHAGSCSSVIAFLDYGCDWIAFEIDKDYYEAASKRIENHKLQLKLF